MIIVTGSVTATATAETDAEIEALCLTHVRRSRDEPGCLLHSVHRDVENKLRFVFLENWDTRADLDRHFELPESINFVKAIRSLASAATRMQVFETVSE